MSISLPSTYACHPLPAQRSNTQAGASLIEVLIAMAILAFGSLAIVNLQTTSIIAVHTSADHFKINELSQVIIEQLKADKKRASLGEYNTEYSDELAPATSSSDIAEIINVWKTTMTRSTPFGETSIQCSTTECTVGLKWYDNSHEDVSEQFYNLKTPI